MNSSSFNEYELNSDSPIVRTVYLPSSVFSRNRTLSERISVSMVGNLISNRQLLGDLSRVSNIGLGSLHSTRNITGTLSTHALTSLGNVLLERTNEILGNLCIKKLIPSSSLIRTRNLVGDVDRTVLLSGNLFSKREVTVKLSKLVLLNGLLSSTRNTTGNMYLVGGLVGITTNDRELTGNLAIGKVSYLPSSVLLSNRNITGYLVKTSFMSGILNSSNNLTGKLTIIKMLSGSISNTRNVVGLLSNNASGYDLPTHLMKRPKVNREMTR